MRKNNYIYSFDTRFSGRVRRDNIADRFNLKPILFFVGTLFILIIIGQLGVVFAYADEVSDELNENIAELISQLDLSDLQRYLEDSGADFLFSYGDTAEEIITYLLRGDVYTDYGSYLNELFSVIFSDALSLVPAFGQILAIALLSAIVANAEGGIISGSTGRIVRLVCAAFIVFLLAAMLYGVADCCMQCMETIRAQVEIITPVLVTLTVLTGGTSSAAIYQPAAVFLSGGAIELVCGFVMPAVIVCCILDFTSHLNPEMSFTGMSKFIKSLVKWAIGITVAVFSIFLTVQSGSASLFDGILYKATKYVVGNSVPIVGGFIAGGLDTLTSAGLLIKSSVGLCGILLLIFEVAEPITLLAAFSLMLKLMSAIVQSIGENGLCSLFSELSSDIQHLIAGLVMVAFMYALVVMLMINSANSFI